MAKTKRIIGLLLVVVFCVTALTGCALFTQTTADSRAQVIATVGNDSIRVSEFVNAYNNLYYQYYYYIYYQVYTESDIAQMTYDSLVNSYLILGSYKELANKEGWKYQHNYTNFKDAEYLTAAEMEFLCKSVKKSLFSSYDSALEKLVTGMGYDLADAAKETESTRVAPEYKNLTSIADVKITAADSAALDKYLETTAGGTLSEFWTTGEGYVFENQNAAALTERLEKLNARITLKDGQTALTAEEYIRLQKQVVANYKESIYTEYGTSVDAYVSEQIGFQVFSRLIGTTTAKIFRAEAEADMPTLLASLQNYYNTKKTSAIEQYIVNPEAYITTVTGLTNTSVIYTVPEQYKGQFIFVKNLLVPFTTEQTTHLTEKAKELGGETTEAYLQYREQYAAQIVLKNYLTDETTSNVFKYNETSKKIELVSGTILSNGLNAVKNGNDFENLMLKYNSDEGQFTADYDYVVRVNAPKDYTAKWVTEFVTASEEAKANGIGIAVSKFGVHIVYYSGDVVAQTPDFTQSKILDTSTFEYKYYSAYYDVMANSYINDQIDALKKTATIKTTSALKSFLSLNGWTITTNK